MCRIFALRANQPSGVECSLIRAPNALIVQARRDLDGFSNADGWGIAAYRNGTVRVDRHPRAAHQHEDFRRAASGVRAETVLAHVRAATVGAVSIENTHPFRHHQWTFVHNGTIPYFDHIREKIRTLLPAEHRAAIAGETDSEHLFHLLLSRLPASAPSLIDAYRRSLADVIDWCRAEGPELRLGLNTILTDGHRLIGSRWMRSLYFIERAGVDDGQPCGLAPAADGMASEPIRAVVIASEPLTDEPWQEVPEHAIFEVTPDFRLRLHPM